MMPRGHKPLMLMTVGDVMSREMILLRPEMTLLDAANCFRDHEISGAPVVDADGACVGVLAAADFVKLVIDTNRSQFVRDFMTGDAVTALTDETLPTIIRKMVNAHIHRVVVVDSARRPIGIVSSTDVLAAACCGDMFGSAAH